MPQNNFHGRDRSTSKDSQLSSQNILTWMEGESPANVTSPCGGLVQSYHKLRRINIGTRQPSDLSAEHNPSSTQKPTILTRHSYTSEVTGVKTKGNRLSKFACERDDLRPDIHGRVLSEKRNLVTETLCTKDNLDCGVEQIYKPCKFRSPLSIFTALIKTITSLQDTSP